MNVLSLFAGIGGLELGLERAGMTVVGQVELDPFCRPVLTKHWPGVPKHDDVRTAAGWWLSCPDCGHTATLGSDRRVWCHSLECCTRRIVPVRPPVDVICGGFPCQDISNAGRREGITGARSGLWAAMRDTVRDIRPRYVVLENVAAIVNRGLDVVAADLDSIGYDLEWDCIPASAVGAPHRRDRWWGIAYPHREQHESRPYEERRPAPQVIPADTDSDVVRVESVGKPGRGGPAVTRNDGPHRSVADTDGRGLARDTEHEPGRDTPTRIRSDADRRGPMADTDGAGLQGHGGPVQGSGQRFATTGSSGTGTGSRPSMADPESIPVGSGLRESGTRRFGWGRPRDRSSEGDTWATEPDVGRVAHGIPRRMDRLRSLGNAVVPQVAEHLGRMILESVHVDNGDRPELAVFADGVRVGRPVARDQLAAGESLPDPGADLSLVEVGVDSRNDRESCHAIDLPSRHPEVNSRQEIA